MEWIVILTLIALTAAALNQTGTISLGDVFNVGNLSYNAIRQLAANAGFTGADLDTATAIALAESGGNPSVVGDLNITPGGSIGLWQINLKAHPQYTAAQLIDPQTNANAAFSVYSAANNSFTPWSTYNSDAYLAYLGTSGGTVGGESA